MSRFKTVRANFTSLPNDVIQGFYLSPNAIAVLITCLSYPNDWDYRPIHIWKKLGLSRDKTYAAFNELVEQGHCIRITTFKGNLRSAIDYIFFDQVPTCQSYIKEHEKELSGVDLEAIHKWNFKKILRHPDPRDTEVREPDAREPGGQEVLKKIEKKRSYEKESTHESKEAPPPTKPQPPISSNQQSLAKPISPSATPAGGSIPLHKENFGGEPKKRKELTQEEWKSQAMKEFLDLTDEDKLKPYFQDAILTGWLYKWGVHLVLDTIRYFLKAHEKQANTDYPIRDPEKWMEAAFKNGYAKVDKICQENKDFAKKIKKEYHFTNLRIHSRYCIDISTRKDVYYDISPEIFQECILRWATYYKETKPQAD